MTKSELIAMLANGHPQLHPRDTELSVRTILHVLTSALTESKRIEIRRFGSFVVRLRPPRIGRNPLSGQDVMVREKKVPHFRAGKELRQRVDVSGKDRAIR
ncbi:MAG: integration host factor subunit beta [Burkholderiaceae bacterium]|jgi:integration host factor subunit beta|nr:integration host factor subunit beta [Burkholderiaceae bacterium]